MDVLLDTNVVRGVGLDCVAFKSLRDYLERTRSRLLWHDVVLEELYAHRRNELAKLARELDAAFKDLRRLDPAASHAAPDIDEKQNLARYQARLLHGAERADMLGNEREDLAELARRLANRTPPASGRGEEARDVLIWLAAKRKIAQRPLALISGDTTFHRDGVLRPELLIELGPLASQLAFFPTLAAFLALHHAKASRVTADWLAERLPMDLIIDDLNEFLWDNKGIFGPDVAKLGEPTGYQSASRFDEHTISAFTVSDLPGDKAYIAVDMSAEFELDVEYYDRLEHDDGSWEVGDDAWSQRIDVSAQIGLEVELEGDRLCEVRVTSVRRAAREW